MPQQQTDDASRRVASGFPSPDEVPGPTERLRQLHGEKQRDPNPPRFGRSSVERAGSDDVVPEDRMTTATSGVTSTAADSIAGVARRVAEETADRIRRDLDVDGLRSRLAGRARAAGLGIGELGVSGLTGLGMVGALTAASVAAWSEVVPVWAAALITSGMYAVPTAYFAVAGQRQLRASADDITGALGQGA